MSLFQTTASAAGWGHPALRTNGNGKSRRDGEIRRAFVCFYNNWVRCLCKTAISFAFLFCYTENRIEKAKEGFL